jgi:hypothetical protein
MNTCCAKLSIRLGLYTEPRTVMLMSWMNDGAYLSDISSEGGKRERMMLKS